jgi:hypothetical protein
MMEVEKCLYGILGEVVIKKVKVVPIAIYIELIPEKELTRM